MAPPPCLQLLLQTVSHHWTTLSSSNAPQPAPQCLSFSPFLDSLGVHAAHISNFFHCLPTISPNTQGARDGIPPITLPFAGLIFGRERRGSKPSNKIADAQVTVGSLQVTEVLRGEKVVEKSHADAASQHPSTNSSAVEQHTLQLQSEQQKVLLWTGPVSKEELGRATWTFLHTLAAQFPDRPTRQQQRDVKELMSILSRIYPCKECADHFKEVLKSNPVKVGSGFELAQWMCRVHNIVNRSLGKPMFPCNRIDARWGAMDCDKSMCDLQGRMQ